eukprot:COSAG02_NODE_11843_length_1643_cov_2.905440_1_plen_210_part_10
MRRFAAQKRCDVLMRVVAAVTLCGRAVDGQSCGVCVWQGLCVDVPECDVDGSSACTDGMLAASVYDSVSLNPRPEISFDECRERCEADTDCTGFSWSGGNHCKTHHLPLSRWMRPTFSLYKCYAMDRTSGCTSDQTCPGFYCGDPNGDYNTADAFDCSGEANEIDADASCTAQNTCTATECCTVQPTPRTCADINADGTTDDPFDCSGET